jgi:hypothetical protein
MDTSRQFHWVHVRNRRAGHDGVLVLADRCKSSPFLLIEEVTMEERVGVADKSTVLDG